MNTQAGLLWGDLLSLGLPQILYGFIPEDARGCFLLMCSLDKMLLPQREHEIIHQKSGDVLDVGEVMLDFSGTLDFPQGLLLTAFYLLQESVWIGA